MPARFILLAICVCTVTACNRREQETTEPTARQATRKLKQATRKTVKTEPKTGKSDSRDDVEVAKNAKRNLKKADRGPSKPVRKKTVRKESRGQEKKSETIIIAERRSYRLEVDSLAPTISVTFAKQWSFSNEFPAELLAGLRKNSKLKKSKFPFLIKGDKKGDVESGTIHWPPDAQGKRAGVMLWFVNGEKRKAVVISVDLSLDHTLGQSRPALDLAFDQLHFSIDLKASKMSAVRWGKLTLPDESSKSPAIDVEATLQVTVTGRLTDESSNSIRLADHLLSERFTQKLGGRGRIDLSNESHHGITLGWLGYERLRHSLLFGAGKPAEAIAFRYRVSGTGFPLRLVSRQIQDDGWPMVLRGHEYVGTAQGDVPVFRPVEYLLSKRPAKKPTKKKKKPVKQ
ncbi:MAG: hypothetical protein IID45_01770 [Planctomycetes bacterium]|nr:hypothetical protein [Planctomycetota bacterium]